MIPDEWPEPSPSTGWEGVYAAMGVDGRYEGRP